MDLPIPGQPSPPGMICTWPIRALFGSVTLATGRIGLPDLTQRSILMLKQANPEWGCQKISDMLLRGPALPASAGAVVAKHPISMMAVLTRMEDPPRVR